MMQNNLLTRKLRRALLLGFLFSLAIFIAWGIQKLRQPTPPLVADTFLNSDVAVTAEPITPIPTEMNLDPAKVVLGDRLFHDPQLSSNDSVSCGSCHLLNKGGTDHLSKSVGFLGSNTGINSPTVFNSGFHFRLNWDGRAESLEEQANGPIAAVKEMGGISWEEVVQKLKASPEYVSAFKHNYKEGISPDNIKDALASFQRSLYTPNAPFDLYLKGNKNAISSQAKKGYDLFKSYGCVSCHQGMLVGGNMFQSLGIFGDYFGDRGNIAKADYGRYNVTGKEEDRYVFKVPSLRNVVLTAPYFHDGNPQTLDEAIKLMGKYQLGVDLPQNDVNAITQFLKSLTGEYNGQKLT